jgi:hypothetical protein
MVNRLRDAHRFEAHHTFGEGSDWPWYIWVGHATVKDSHIETLRL